jgi:hypothetical protein
MEKEDIQLLKNLEKRVEYIESLESIQYPTHIKELINDLMDRVDELELQNKKGREFY